MEGWQSGNAPDSKSGEPANTGAQVQILYLPYITFHNRGENIDIQAFACNVFAPVFLFEYVFEYVLLNTDIFCELRCCFFFSFVCNVDI